MSQFKPTKQMSLAKAKMWSKINSNPLIGAPEHLSQDHVARLMGRKEVGHWYQIDGFEPWLMDNTHNAELLESAVEAAIYEAIKVLEVPVDGEKGSPRWADKLSAIKLVLDYAGFAPKKGKKADEMDDISEEALDKLIAKQLKQQNITAQ